MSRTRIEWHRALAINRRLNWLCGRITKGEFTVRSAEMAGSDDWKRVLPVDTDDDVHVATRGDGVTILYTGDVEAFIRSDTAVDLSEHR